MAFRGRAASILKLGRHAASFILNCVLATVGTNMLTAPFEPGRLAKHLQMSQLIFRSELSSAVVAFTLGAFVSWKWKWLSAAARYVWVVGLLWLVLGLSKTMGLQASSVLSQQDFIHTAYSLISGADCIDDFRACAVWGDYPLQLWRTIFYSAGAVCITAYGYFGARLRSRRIGDRPR